MEISQIQTLFSEFLAQNQPSAQLKNVREKAFQTFLEQGFPTKKQEAWKYTSLSGVLGKAYDFLPQAPVQFPDFSEHFLPIENSLRLLFVNGFYQGEYFTTPEGLSVRPLHERFFAQGKDSVANENEAFTALNTAFAQGGVSISVPKGKAIEPVVQLLFISVAEEKNVWTQPRNIIELGQNAQAKFVEIHQSVGKNHSLTNSVTEILVEKDALLDYYKIENDAHTATLVDNTYITQGQNANASVHTFAMGGEIVRNNLNFYHLGENVDSTLKGVTVLDARQHTDHYTLVHHAQPHCQSHQDYKSIVKGEATNVFNGKIMVDKIAQKTDAYQQNDNVLLSPEATVYTKPQLEIFADDVKCSHGCTIGELDKDAMFYLQTRGIPKQEAQGLLTYAFAHSVLSSVKVPEVKHFIERLISKKLEVSSVVF